MNRLARTTGRNIALVFASAGLVALMGCNALEAPVGGLGEASAPGSRFALETPLASSKALVKAIEVQDRKTHQLMSIRGVIGTGASLDRNEQPVVVVFAEDESATGIPSEIDGVPVVVEVVGKVEALQAKGKNTGSSTTTATNTATCSVNRAGRFERPVPIGVSTGHPNVTAGTIGVRVKNSRGALFLLSNNHVFANTNNATAGQNILQPGPIDGGVNPGDAIATLNTWVPIAFCSGSVCANNAMDAALAATTSALAGRATPCDGYGTPAKSVATATTGLQVKKYGRTTGLTSGTIAAVNVTISVGYAAGTARFTGQVYINTPNFIGGGDSGSLIVTQTGNKPVALLFAGTSTAAFATPISTVLNQFRVTIDGV